MHDLSALAAFLAVLRAGNLPTAARLTSIPKSTLSRRIRELESAVGKVLLRREAKRLIPTEAGEVLARYAEQIVSLADQGQEALRDLNEEVSGELSIYADNAIVRAWLAKLVQGFVQRHPEVTVRLLTRTDTPTPDHHSQVHFWVGSPPEPLRQESLGSLRFGLYASPAYLNKRGWPSTPEDAARHRWIRMAEEQNEVVLRNREGCEQTVSVRGCLFVDQLILLGDGISLGMGIGMLPTWIAELRARAHPESMVRCLPEWEGEPQSLWLLYPHGHLPRRLSVFLDFVRSQIPAQWRDDAASDIRELKAKEYVGTDSAS